MQAEYSHKRFSQIFNHELSFYAYLFWHCSRIISLFQYLSKQNLALREVNESRVKVYEQLEENLTEVEAANKKLNEEAKADKEKIKR